MSYESDECKLLIDEAIHNYFHDETETEMAVKDWFYDLLKQAAKADEYEAENKELLEELNYLKTVNNDLVWQRDTDEEHEAKAKAWDRTQVLFEECTHKTPGDDYEVDWHEFEMKIDDIINKYESGEYNAKK